MKSELPEFISIPEYSAYDISLLKDFVKYSPNEQPSGYYKVHFLGKISNPNAKWEGYLSTGNYFLYQLRSVKNFAFAVVESMAAGSDFNILSVILLIVGFILGILIRLPIGILLTIIQFFVLLFASKSNEIKNT